MEWFALFLLIFSGGRARSVDPASGKKLVLLPAMESHLALHLDQVEVEVECGDKKMDKTNLSGLLRTALLRESLQVKPQGRSGKAIRRDDSP